MWNDTREEVADRILASKEFFRGASRRGIVFSRSKTMTKGLMFVQLYAIYEFTVVTIVQNAINELNSKCISINTLRRELLGLALHTELSSIADCGYKKVWDARLELFQRIDSSDYFRVADTTVRLKSL